MKIPSRLRQLRDHKGATLILVAIAMVMLLGFAAIAVDVGYLYVVRGELQNAADAGALAGAQVVYDDPTTTTDVPGTQVYAGANTVALNFVTAHNSENATVTLAKSYRDASGNLMTCNQLADGSCIERGHWSFATHTFTPNASLVPVDLWNVTTEQLDANTNFINAVRVITTRKRDANAQLPEHFFAYIFGAPRSDVNAVAVGYIGFAGSLMPLEIDQPIAICMQALLNQDGLYTCGVGRMINSGTGNEGHQTGGWSNFTQSPCDTASANTVKPLVCKNDGSNPGSIALGQGMGTTGGEVQTAYDKLLACWMGSGATCPSACPALDTNGDGIPDQPWKMTLPVIDCPGNNTGTCSSVVGAVTVDIVWITRTDKNQMIEVPRKMEDWSCPQTSTGQACWDSFAERFQLRDVLNNSVAFYEDKTIYFKPDCTAHAPAGITGGQNFGILAKTPVLVK